VGSMAKGIKIRPSKWVVVGLCEWEA